MHILEAHAGVFFVFLIISNSFERIFNQTKMRQKRLYRVRMVTGLNVKLLAFTCPLFL